MRIDVVSLLLLSAGWATAHAVSQNIPATAPRPSHPAITSITVAELDDGVAVEVAFTARVQAEVTAIEHPDRLVFDFPGCELTHPSQRLAVNRGAVIAVRAAIFSAAPPVARIVIDLKSALDHEETYTGNNLVIKLKSSSFKSTEDHPTPAADIHAANTPPVAPSKGQGQRADQMPPKPGASHSLGGSSAATARPTAYTLLAKARALTLSDLESLEAQAETGDPESQTTLALAYHAGTLLKLDDAKALRLLQHAANRGFLAAEEAMGIFYQSGFGMPPDKAQAISWYTKAAQHGSRDAATNLALMYSTGDGIAKDSTRAATWFLHSAEAGDATAQLNLAALYHRGEGVPQDDAQAAIWLTRAAEQGFVPAMLELGTWNLRPEHGSKVDAAIAWFKKAADLGDASAQSTLGDIYVDQELGRVDFSQAVDWYRKAADQGHSGGEFGLGTRYLMGEGVPQDLTEARRWLTPAANQGHPYAQILLAKMFQAGEGGSVDTTAAEKYYELAAVRGFAPAQYQLGLLLSADRGNGAGLVSAYKWLVLAQDSVKESAAAAQELRKSLAPEQITQAEHEIDEWRAAHPRRDSTH